jgi:hypothetical protein
MPARTLSAHLADLPEGKSIEIWFQDEAGIDQSEQDKKSIQWIDFPANGIVRQWARRALPAGRSA